MITFRAYRRRRLTPRPRFQVLLSVLLLFCARASAQLPPNVSTDTGVTLLTVLPGDPAYTMFGHTALRFVDPATGLDASFNYGTFDFDKTFVFRFASGKLDYRLDVVPTEPSFRHYRSENRTIIEPVGGRNSGIVLAVADEPATGESILPLRLLSRQLLDANPRHPRGGDGVSDPRVVGNDCRTGCRGVIVSRAVDAVHRSSASPRGAHEHRTRCRCRRHRNDTADRLPARGVDGAGRAYHAQRHR